MDTCLKDKFQRDLKRVWKKWPLLHVDLMLLFVSFIVCFLKQAVCVQPCELCSPERSEVICGDLHWINTPGCACSGFKCSVKLVLFSQGQKDTHCSFKLTDLEERQSAGKDQTTWVLQNIIRHNKRLMKHFKSKDQKSADKWAGCKDV